MPQMSPMNWILMFNVFSILMLIVLVMISFMMINSPNLKSLIEFKLTLFKNKW